MTTTKRGTDDLDDDESEAIHPFNSDTETPPSLPALDHEDGVMHDDAAALFVCWLIHDKRQAARQTATMKKTKKM